MVKETVRLEEEEIPLDVRVCKKEEIEGKMKPERIMFESSLAGTGLEAPGQQRLSSKEMEYCRQLIAHRREFGSVGNQFPSSPPRYKTR